MTNHPLKNPPARVKQFWRSSFGQMVVRTLQPSTWWNVIFGIAGIVMIVWTLTIYKAEARAQATHAAELAANAQTQFQACKASIPVAKKINDFIRGDQIVRDALVLNSEASLAATPRNAPTYPTRLANLRRLKAARAAAFQVKFPVQTKASCRALHARLLKAR